MTEASDQPPRLPQYLENSVLPYSIPHIEQRFRQTFSNSTRPEENAVSNIPRNNDDDDDDEFDGNNDPNSPPPVSTSSSRPTIRTIKGNLVKHDNSVRKTNISSHNAEDNTIKDAFNDNYVDPSRQCLCLFFLFLAYRVIDLIFSI